MLSLLSSQLTRLNIGVAALSEVRRPDCGEIMVGGYTYYCSGHPDGNHAQGVAVAVSNKLTPMIIQVTPVSERIMRLRYRHSVGSTSCAASLRRAAHRMTGLGQSLRDPLSLMIGGKPRGNIPGSDCGRVCESSAEGVPSGGCLECPIPKRG